MDQQFFIKAVMILVPMILSLTVHEYAHALAAKLLGDETAEHAGRLTLNPIPHIDIVGTILLPLISIGTSMPFFGWAKPVPTVPMNYTKKVSMRTGYMLVSIAGPLSNIIFGTLAMIVMKVMILQGIPLSSFFYRGILAFILINIGLAIFNMIPFPPLDGSKLLQWFLPEEWANKLEQYSMFFFIGLMILIFNGGLNFLGRFIFDILLFMANTLQMQNEFIMAVNQAFAG